MTADNPPVECPRCDALDDSIPHNLGCSNLAIILRQQEAREAFQRGMAAQVARGRDANTARSTDPATHRAAEARLAAPTLIEFLRACLDEDQRVAEQGLHGHNPIRDDDDDDGWSIEAMNVRQQREDDWNASWHTSRCGYLTGEMQEECECGVPSRVLAEIAAKRAILDMHGSCGLGYGYCDTHGGVGGITDADGRRPGCWTAQILAQPFAGRSGFREEWAVKG